MAQSVHGYLVVVEYFCPLTVYTVQLQLSEHDGTKGVWITKVVQN